ncbi:MAG: DHH family phosphoesterase [Lachnospiraceae bacterium]
MNNKLKFQGIAKRYLQLSIALGFMLVLADVMIYFISPFSGFLMTIFVALYIVANLWYLFNTKKIVFDDFIYFATEYGQVQKQLLEEFDVPHALVDENNKIVWGNVLFKELVDLDEVKNKALQAFFPSLSRDKLPGMVEYDELELFFTYEEKELRAKVKKISLENMVKSTQMLDAMEYDGYLLALYIYDESALRYALREVDDQSLAVGLFYLDNYEEALESIDEVRRSLLIALIDRKLNKYISSFDGICKKIEKDKYIVILRKKSLKQLQDTRFEVLEDIKTVNIGNDMAVTLSIGIGYEGITYVQNYEYARTAIGVALGRGGDQAVVKSSTMSLYYGGKSQQVEKNTRVKARVKAHALREIITTKDNVIVMGHRFPDVDCFGAAVGIYRVAKLCDKKVNIVLNDVSGTLQPLIHCLQEVPGEYEEDMIISPKDAAEYVTPNTVLVVVDVNKPSITECPELLRLCKSIVVFDHHRQGEEIISNAILSYIEPYASSTCEMVSEILQYTSDNIKIRTEEADCMYAGIVVDTNNFLTKTGVRTFEAAAFLRRNGADVTRVRKMFREDALNYKTRADVVSQAEIFYNRYAISFCNTEDVSNVTIIGAQAANELLNIKGVQASFVLTPFQGKIYISARSIDEVNVQVIMEKLGGGGHHNIAACQLEDITLVEAEGIVKELLAKMIEDGEL